MPDKQWQKVREIFDAALRRPREERREFIAEVCADDELLLGEVESLLDSLDSAESFLETPAVAKVAGAIEAERKAIKAGTCFGHYEIINPIGAGGMGEVYLARDKKLDRQVAVKILNEKFAADQSNLQRFIKEAKAASALNHPNILVIHEIGAADETHFIVSEFIKGKTLREVFREKPLKLSEVLDISIQIAGALCAAHEARLVHRDIKPENVMIRPDGYVKILDFGLAKLVERQNKSFLGLENAVTHRTDTAKGVVLGTINYMSPEQAKGERVDERTDVFSFGVLIYEMLAGKTPFAGDSVSETLANLIKTEPAPLSNTVPDEMRRIVSKTLRKDKDRRYQTMRDVLADLKELRETVTLDAKLDRSASDAAAGRATAVLQATTGGDLKQQTAQTLDNLSRQFSRHNRLAVLVLILLAVGAAALGYYFFPTRKPSATTTTTTTAAAVNGKKSFAVLPLKPIGAANRDEIYEVGIADSLIIKLGLMKGFIVRPLSATRKYSDVGQDPIAAGKEQQVDYVLDSNYQIAGGRIRITAQLFNIATGQIEETYKSEKNAGDVFAMQDAVAGEVGNILARRFAAVSSSPTAMRGTTNEEAYRLYLQGTNLTARRSAADANKAIEYFEQAIGLDPNFARAYSGIAFAYRASGTLGGGSPREQFEKARAAVNRALALDPNLAEAYAVRGDLKHKTEWDIAEAEKDLLRAIELEPNNDLAHGIYAGLLVETGRFDEGFAELETALEIAPDSLTNQRDRGRYLYFARRYDEAIVQLKRVLEVDKNFQSASGWLISAYEMKGDYAGAYESLLERVKQTNPGNLETYQKAHATAGWQEVRRKNLEWLKLREHQPDGNPYAIAKDYALLGDKEQAFEYLNKAVEKRQSQLVMLKVEPTFDNLRGDPRFGEMLRRVGLK